jgi:acyl-CoA synthetase (NDP forming)
MRVETERTDAHGQEVVARLRAMFGARSVALVGATDRSQWSKTTYENLRTFSPGVDVHLVHPRHLKVHGQATVPSLRDLPTPVDLAYLMVPTSAVLEVVGEAAEVGIRNLVILTAGFSETGDEGFERERQLVALTRDRQLTVLGPNGNGFVNLAGSVTPFGLPIQPPLESGPVGVVLQSGGMASVVLTGALGRGIGVSLLVSTGNEAVTSATDVMRYLIADDETRVVAAFLESVRDPDEFRVVAGLALEAGKPLVVLKVGRSEIGARVAQAHTGALADDDRVVSAAFEQLGVIQVDSLEEMVATAGYLGHHPGVRGRRIAAVTASGGVCNLVADQCATEGLELPEFPPETLEELGQILPEFSNPHNPLDVTGYIVVDPAISGQALRAVARRVEGYYDILLYQMGIPTAEPRDPALVERRFDSVIETRAEVPVPLVLLGVMSSNLHPFAHRVLGDRGLYVLDGIALGIRAIGHGARYQERRDAWLARTEPTSAPRRPRPAGAHGVWAEHRVRDLLTSAGVPQLPARVAHSHKEAAEFAADLGGRIVLKAVSDELVHKSDAGGVRLDIDPASAASVYESLMRDVASSRPDINIDGVLVTPYRPGGVELLVGVVTDPAWGKVLSLGLGGVWVEIFDDIAMRLLPLTEADVIGMLGSLRAAPLLHGARGSTPVNLDAVSAVVVRIARLAESLGDALHTLEINPLRVEGDAVEVLDALAVWHEELEEKGAAR